MKNISGKRLGGFHGQCVECKGIGVRMLHLFQTVGRKGEFSWKDDMENERILKCVLAGGLLLGAPIGSHERGQVCKGYSVAKRQSDGDHTPEDEVSAARIVVRSKATISGVAAGIDGGGNALFLGTGWTVAGKPIWDWKA